MSGGGGGGGARLLSLLRPYSMLFAATIAATVISSVLDGFTFVLLIPFLRTLFGNAALPAEGGSHVETVLNEIAGPFLQAGTPALALRNVVIVLLVALRSLDPSSRPARRRSRSATSSLCCWSRWRSRT